MVTSAKPVILWFRQDLRLQDNPAFIETVNSGAPVLPLYILDDENAGNWKMGGASRVWLHHSLQSLNKSLKTTLLLKSGNAADVLKDLIKKTGASAVYWNRCYEPWRIKRDKALKSILNDEYGTETHSFNASLLWEPWQIKKDDGTPYKVFTPYYRRGCLSAPAPLPPAPSPKRINYFQHDLKSDELNLLPQNPEWHKTMLKHWDIGESGANKALDTFIENGLKGYKEQRNVPSLSHTSRLSPHLHFGEISARTIWHKVLAAGNGMKKDSDVDCFLSELGWREFSYYLLYHFPQLPETAWNSKFNKFPWAKTSAAAIKTWQKGQTGYPIVDAGMRELWQTGTMHNRVRMVVASFLTKHMRQHWVEGEQWFWDTLFDADLASNAASWQWVAGCGADAAPYFRIFNPITQSEKFDPEGTYIKKYVPELKNLPAKFIHAPWKADYVTLKAAGIDLGKTYPSPMLDHTDARQAALNAYQSMKEFEPE